MKINIKKSLLLSSILGVTSMGFYTTAAAQTVETVPSSQTSSSQESDEIIVTGSRIRRSNIDTAQPITSVDEITFESRAFTNLADALTEIPQFGAGVDPNGDVNTFTAGQNFVNLFELGTQRTLTLVNGRRFVSSNVPTVFGSAGGLQVDLNAIPLALTERVEIVPVTGAAVYGSDAIAGVVNVILKEDFEGIEASGQYGQTEQGDGDSYQLQTVMGANFDNDRGNITLALEYNEQDGLLRTDRPRYTTNDPYFLNFGGQDLDGDGVNDDVDGDGLPDSFSRIERGQRVQLLSAGGSISTTAGFFAPSVGIGRLPDGNFYQFAQDGSLQTCTPGETPAGSIFFANGGTCGEDFFDQVDQLRSPIRRFIAASTGHYDITNNIRFNQEFMFANTRSAELVEQGGFQSFPFGGTSGPVTISSDNPFLTTQARNVLNANGLSQFNLNRFNNDLVQSGSNTENFTFRAVVGFEGDFEVSDRNFNWDVTYLRGESDVETRTVGIIDARFLNAVDAVRVDDAYLDSLIAADTTGAITDRESALAQLQGIGGTGTVSRGSIICRVVGDVATGTQSGFNSDVSGSGITDGDRPFINGCVPLNVFGEGNASSEALAFINGGPAITSSDIAQQVITANFGGDLFDVPAGVVGFNVGYETRRDSASFTPGLGASIPITRSSPFPPTTGSQKTEEFYGEARFPIVSSDMDIPFVELAEAEGAIRSVKNTITDPNGISSSATNEVYSVSGRYSPLSDITFRGSYATAIRTPSLVELFTPEVQAFISGDDPCDNREVNQGPDPATRRANCITAGVADPDNFTSNIQNATIIGATSGNPNLTAEKSESYTIGAVITPRWIDNLAVTVDYFNIDIEDRIENFDFETLAENCFDSSEFPNLSCSAFVRDPATGQVIDVTEQFLNAAASTFEGVSVAAQYNFDVADLFKRQNDWGQIGFNLNVMREITRKTQVLINRPADEDVGDFGGPRWQGVFDTTWDFNKLRVFHRVEFQDAALLDATGDQRFLDLDENLITKTDARFIHNASVAYEVFDGTVFQLSVDNLFDREPDLIQEAAGHFGIDELLGRRYRMSVRTRF